MIDHVSLRVSNLEQALPAYKAALAPLGYQVAMEFPGFVGLSDGRGVDFWLTATDKPVNPAHIAFATDRAGVHAFYEAAIAAGMKDNGPPGPRAEYTPTYYGAFVLDADGNNIEAVTHRPDGTAPTMDKPKKPAAKKAPAKKAPAKKPAAKKAPAKKPAAKKAPAKKPAAKKAPAKKAPAKKPAKPKARGRK